MTGPEQLSFADGPRLDLDEALSALVAQAERVRSTQGRRQPESSPGSD